MSETTAHLMYDYRDRSAKDAGIRAAEESLAYQLSGTIALVLAQGESVTPLAGMDAEGKPLAFESGEGQLRALQTLEGKTALSYAIDAATDAGVRATYVLVPAGHEQGSALEAEALACGAKGVVRFDKTEERTFAAAYKGFELVKVSAYVLEVGRALLEADSEANSLLLLSPEQVRITAGHLRALNRRLTESPWTEAVASWIMWQRRLPILVTRAFLGRLDELRAIAEATDAPYTPLPMIALTDVVFGEEPLAANSPINEKAQEFLGDVSLSALEAIALARRLRGLPEDEFEEGYDKATQRFSESDKQVLAFAFEVVDDVAESEKEIGDEPREDLAWADAWARRNKVDFPLLNDRKHAGKLSYLDSAATSQRCIQAITAMRDFDTHENANVYRGGYDLSMQATFSLNDARAAIEGFIGANRRETIFTSNTTDGANIVAQAWGVNNVDEGDLVVVCMTSHHSNLLPWMILAEQKGARLAYVPYKTDGKLDQDEYDRLLERGPKIVALTMIGNVFGIANPIEDMAKRAHAVGAKVFVDAAQGLPHKAVNVYDLGCDFFAFSSHKMYGPMGLGGLWVHPDALAQMRPYASGGGAISHVGADSYYLRLGAIGYELGTPAVSQAIGFAAAVNYLETIGMDNVSRHGAVMSDYLMRGLGRLDGVRVLGRHDMPAGKTGLVSLLVDGATPSETGTVLGKLGVCVRSGAHCAMPLAASLGNIGTVRLSLGVYNTAEDIEAALVGLRVCRHLYGA